MVKLLLVMLVVSMCMISDLFGFDRAKSLEVCIHIQAMLEVVN